MQIEVQSETKIYEDRVGLTSDSTTDPTGRGHMVFVQAGAGLDVGFSERDYLNAGANGKTVFEASDLIVKGPQPHERAWLRAEQTLFTHLHLPADKPQAEALIDRAPHASLMKPSSTARGTPPA